MDLALLCQVLLYVFIVALVLSIGRRVVKARAEKQIEEELMRKQQLEIQRRMLEQMEHQTQLSSDQIQFISGQQTQGRN
jgi:hypothetical protein